MVLLDEHGSDIRALVTDIALGTKVTGWEVARRARDLNDILPVIYMSGGNGHEWAVNGVPGSVLVAKPFAPSQVVTAVAQLLNTGES